VGHTQRLNELPTIREKDESIVSATVARAPVAGRKAQEGIPFVQGSGEVIQGRVSPHSERPGDGVTRLQLHNEKLIERNNMLYTLAVILIVLWVLGLVSSYTMGGLIHILLVVAVVMVLFNLFSGRRGA
jgi:hypothetical protein